MRGADVLDIMVHNFLLLLLLIGEATCSSDRYQYLIGSDYSQQVLSLTMLYLCLKYNNSSPSYKGAMYPEKKCQSVIPTFIQQILLVCPLCIFFEYDSSSACEQSSATPVWVIWLAWPWPSFIIRNRRGVPQRLLLLCMWMTSPGWVSGERQANQVNPQISLGITVS